MCFLLSFSYKNVTFHLTITKFLYTIFLKVWLKFTVPKKSKMRICQQKLGRLTRYVFIGILVSHKRRPFHYLKLLYTSFTGREQRVRERRRVRMALLSFSKCDNVMIFIIMYNKSRRVYIYTCLILHDVLVLKNLNW